MMDLLTVIIQPYEVEVRKQTHVNSHAVNFVA